MSPRVSAEKRDEYLQERREQILDAAIEVFGKKGFAGANVSDIAKAADIAKGTVYLYFKSKDEIFGAILSERSYIPHITNLVSTMEDAPLDVALTHIGRNFLKYWHTHAPLLRLIITDAYRLPTHAEQAYKEVILKGTQLLADFLSAQVKAGRIRPLDDPFLTAHAFGGMLIVYFVTQEMFGGKHITPIKEEAWLGEVVRVFLDGIRRVDVDLQPSPFDGCDPPNHQPGKTRSRVRPGLCTQHIASS